jgi:serine/threonine protein kinase
MNLSQHGGTQRQLLARIRDNTELTDVYDIVQTIGRGSMGEVYIVEKKPHSLRKAPSSSSVSGINADPPASPLPTNRSDQPAVLFTPQAPPLETAAPASPVSVASSKFKKSRQYACKTVTTLLMQPHEIREFINEVLILRDLDHPNIVQLFEVFQFKRKIWIVTELCRGGDLTSRIHQMNEEDVAVVMEQIVRAVAYMHSRDVCHRDIKLENIMYATKDEDSPIKLIDFGLSNRFTRGVKMLQACGTAYTAAPEILLKEGYTEKSDIWSIGVITYVLLSQTYPFLKDLNDLEDAEKRENLQNAKVTFGPEWEKRKISSVAKEFICMCLKKEPMSRWSATAAVHFVQHTWIPFLDEQRKIAEHGVVDVGITKCLSTTNLSLLNKDTDITVASTAQSGSFDQFVKPAVTPDMKHDEYVTRQETRRNKSALQNSVTHVRKRIKLKTAHIDSMSNFSLYGSLKKTILMTMVYSMDKSRSVS